jgi:hypothetical protein
MVIASSQSTYILLFYWIYFVSNKIGWLFIIIGLSDKNWAVIVFTYWGDKCPTFGEIDKVDSNY